MAEMRIDLRIGGLSGVVGGLSQVTRGYAHLAIAQEMALSNVGKLAAAHAQFSRSLGGRGFGLPVAGQLAPPASAPPALPPNSPRVPAGPETRLQQSQATLATLRAQGAPLERLRDAMGAVARAQNAVGRQNALLTGPTLGTRIARLIGSTRISVGKFGGFEAMPLVGRLGAVFGVASSKVAILAAGLTVAAGATKLFAEGVKFAATRLGELADAARFSGGTGAQAAQLQAFGLPAGQIASIARAFREETAIGGGNIFAQIARSRLGVPLTGGRGFGSTNEAQPLIQAITGLRRVGQGPGGRDEQTRIVQAIPSLEPLLRTAQASDRVFNSVLADMEQAGKLADANPSLQAATDFQVQSGRLWNNLKNSLAGTFAPFIGQVADLMGGLADAARGSGPALSGLMGVLIDIGGVLGFAGRAGLQAVGFLGRLATALKLTDLLGAVGKGLMVVADLFGKLANGLLGSFGRVLDATVSTVGKLVGWIGELANKSGLAGALQTLGESAIWAVGKISDLLDKIPGAKPGTVKDFFDPGSLNKLLQGAAGKGDPLIDALAKNAAAVAANTGALKGVGTFGGGARSRAALGPAGLMLSPTERRRWLEEQVKSLGFWGQ